MRKHCSCMPSLRASPVAAEHLENATAQPYVILRFHVAEVQCQDEPQVRHSFRSLVPGIQAAPCVLR